MRIDKIRRELLTEFIHVTAGEDMIAKEVIDTMTATLQRESILFFEVFVCWLN